MLIPTVKQDARLGLLVLILSFGLKACGPSGDQSGGQESSLHFLTFGPNYSGLIAKVKKPQLRGCTRGIGDNADWIESIQSATLKWIEPLRQLTSDKLAAEVEVIANGQQDCDFYVTARAYVHANTQLMSTPVVNMASAGYFASYNVLLHEFGHAFALADTYVGGRSGACARGQPQAVMCNTSFSDLQPDDIKGVQTFFKRVYPDDQPGLTAGDDEGDDKDRGQDVGGASDSSSIQLFASLGPKQRNGRHLLYMTALGGREGSMAVCVGGVDDCNSSTGTFKVSRKEAAIQNQPYFALTNFYLSDDLLLTMRYIPDGMAEPVYRTIVVRRS